MSRTLVLALVALAGCGPANNSYQGDVEPGLGGSAWYLNYPESDLTSFASAIDREAQGFALGEGRATVAMRDMTCGVQIDTGSVFFDLDLRSGRVMDSTDDPEMVLTALQVAPPLVSLVPVDRPTDAESYLVRGVQQARLLDDGGFVAAQRDDDGECALRWYEDGHLTGSLGVGPDFRCDGDLDLALDLDTDRAFLAGPSGVLAASLHDGVVVVSDVGDQVAWDAATGTLVFGALGGTELVALHGDEVVWQVTLPGPLSALDDGGAAGGAVVAYSVGLGAEVVRLDADGQPFDRLTFDQPVLDLAVSQGGELMAVSRVTDHGYYRLQPAP